MVYIVFEDSESGALLDARAGDGAGYNRMGIG